MSANGLWENLAAVFVSYYKYALQVKFSRNLRVLKFPFLIILDLMQTLLCFKSIVQIISKSSIVNLTMDYLLFAWKRFLIE